ncbi:MAG: stage II sporulation protein R [Lachnospiraceae bacterium]|nr:stage II sporulation protein R [Lachnospiraceae bacterium]
MKEQDSSTAKKELLLALACFLAAAFLWAFQARLEQGQLAERIAPHILRFHVLANSNSAADQEIKIEVKSFLLERIYGHLGEDAAKSDVVAYLEAERQTLEAEAEQFIRRLGKEQTVSLDVVWCAFPEKYYGELKLPAGTYEAAQVRIGQGRGRNWWCILYPKVCVTKGAVATVPEGSIKELEELLSPEDLQALYAQRPLIHLDFQLWQLFSTLPALQNHLPPSSS